MKLLVFLAALAFLPALQVLGGDEPPKGVLDFDAKDIDGNTVSLSKYKGDVVLIVNTASACGCTPQYEDLQALYAKYKEKGFTVLAFPCNDFGQQEKGSEAQIKEFCTSNYEVTFPLFSKVVVKGKDKMPLYANLIGNPTHGGEIKWNFTKFLVGRDGAVIGRFEPRVEPDTPEVVEAIEAALAKPKG